MDHWRGRKYRRMSCQLKLLSRWEILVVMCLHVRRCLLIGVCVCVCVCVYDVCACDVCMCVCVCMCSLYIIMLFDLLH